MRTARTLRIWFDEIGNVPGDVAFPNARGGTFSSDGVAYVLNMNESRKARYASLSKPCRQASYAYLIS